MENSLTAEGEPIQTKLDVHLMLCLAAPDAHFVAIQRAGNLIAGVMRHDYGTHLLSRPHVQLVLGFSARMDRYVQAIAPWASGAPGSWRLGAGQ